MTPDPYWEKIGKEIREKRQNGIESNRRLTERQEWDTCTRCGEKFHAGFKRRLCSDCVGERSEEGIRTEGDRIKDGARMRKDDDP